MSEKAAELMKADDKLQIWRRLSLSHRMGEEGFFGFAGNCCAP